jgi:hypothetical protein
MAQAHATRRPFARLTFEDGEVVVTPKDRSVFLISAEKATEACRDVVRLEERIERFESEFLVPLHDWCLAHEDRVRACYVPMPGSHIQVFVVTVSPAFDYDLAAELAALELKLARRGWRVGVSQLPYADDESPTMFFNPEGALAIHAQPGPAPHESRTDAARSPPGAQYK